MDFLILPTFPETFDTSSSCTCYMAEIVKNILPSVSQSVFQTVLC